MAIINDPFNILGEAFINLYPNKPYKAYIDTNVTDGDGEPVLGVTNFPFDGSEPTIFIVADMAIVDAAETFAHELAHVAAGVDNDHNELWQDAYKRILGEYDRIGEERFGPQNGE